MVSLLTDLSSEMIYPLLPVFLTATLGAGAVGLGIVEGVAEATASLLKIGSGRLTDRTRRRKPFIAAGYGLSSAIRPLIGLAGSWPWVAAFRLTDRIGKGVRTSPRDTLIADTTPEHLRGAAYGYHRAMDNAGAVLGPLVAAGLLAAGLGLRSVFLLAAIPGLAVVWIIWRHVRERPEAIREQADPDPGADRTAVPPGLGRLIAAVAVFALGNSTDAFILLRFSDLGMAAGAVAGIWAAHNAVKALTSWYAGSLSDRVGRRPLVIVGWLVYVGVYLGFAIGTSTAALIGLFLVYGLVFGITEPVERSWIAHLSRTGRRGSAFGWYHGVVGIAALPASLAFGLLYTGVGPAAAFGLGAALALVATVILLTVDDRAAGRVATG